MYVFRLASFSSLAFNTMMNANYRTGRRLALVKGVGRRGFTVVEPGLRVLICTEHDSWTDIPVQLVCTYPVGNGKMAQ